jgi:hypothetical protein
MSTKLHPTVTSGGQVVEGFLSGGNVNDIEAAPELVQDVLDVWWRRTGDMTAMSSASC